MTKALSDTTGKERDPGEGFITEEAMVQISIAPKRVYLCARRKRIRQFVAKSKTGSSASACAMSSGFSTTMRGRISSAACRAALPLYSRYRSIRLYANMAEILYSALLPSVTLAYHNYGSRQ